MQKILTIWTVGDDLRSPADSWSWEVDTDKVRMDKPIGLSSEGHCPCYDCVLKALADGWRLLAPPEVRTGRYNYYKWWLTKE